MAQHPEIEALLAVDRCDVEIARIDDDIAFVVRTLEKERAEIDAIEAKIATLDEQRKAIAQQVDRIDLDMKANTDKQQKLRVQRNQVKTNEEYAALGRQIDLLDRDNAAKEERVLELYEEQERIEAEIEERKRALEAANEAFSRRRRALEADREALEKERAQQLAAREEALEAVSAQTRTIYERVLNKVHGRALAPLSGRMCRGCHVELPTNLVAQVLSAREIVRCPQCARFLYADQSASASAHSYTAHTDRSSPMPGD